MPAVTPTKPARPAKRASPPRPARPPQTTRLSPTDRPAQVHHRSPSLKAEAGDSGRNAVRIIAGAWRGRRVSFPDLPGLRPTPDRVRETVFNWLQHETPGARCLDLFAGSGALGLEALSRGAQEAVFVETAQAAARALVAELARLGGATRGRVVEMGAARFLRGAEESYGKPFDITFLDPPFGQNMLAEYIPLLDRGDWVKAGGMVYLESEKSVGVPAIPAHWELLKSKSAGEVGYHLVRVHARADQR